MAQVLADLSSLQNTVRRPPLSSTSSYSSVAPTSRAPSPPPPTTVTSPNPSSASQSYSSSSQDPAAAAALVDANKKPAETHVRRKSKGLLPEPAQFDKLGRRRLTTRTPSYNNGYNNGARSPISMGMPRMGSSFSSLPSSGAATPTSGKELVRTSLSCGQEPKIFTQLLKHEIAR